MTIAEIILFEFIALGCFTAFIIFSYCDGFRMKTFRKLIWASFFLVLCYASVTATGHFVLHWIISFSSLLAFTLAWFQRNDNLKLKMQQEYNV